MICLEGWWAQSQIKFAITTGGGGESLSLNKETLVTVVHSWSLPENSLRTYELYGDIHGKCIYKTEGFPSVILQRGVISGYSCWFKEQHWAEGKEIPKAWQCSELVLTVPGMECLSLTVSPLEGSCLVNNYMATWEGSYILNYINNSFLPSFTLLLSWFLNITEMFIQC